jgi:uncharacterized protein (TIGR03083 family)
MRDPQPVLVADLFPELLEALLAVLRSLDDAQWQQPTACAGWSVHDVALHLLGGDAGILSRQRDGYRPGEAEIRSWNELVAFINAHNARWVEATRRLSPRLVVDLLTFTGPQVTGYFQSRDPHALSGPVSWAGDGPAPVWLDLAREYTERWLHQQHIREAVGTPLLEEPRYLAPVLATFVHALPAAYRERAAPAGIAVALTIAGPAGGQWVLRREVAGWVLAAGVDGAPACHVILPAGVAWRLFTRGVPGEAARAQATVTGDEMLAAPFFDAVAIIA